MLARYPNLSKYPQVFKAMSGLQVGEFERLSTELIPLLEAARVKRLSRSERQRDPGGGAKAQLSLPDQLLLTIVWLRLYPSHEVLGFLFGVSDTTAGRVIQKVLPVLAANGLDTMRRPDPGRKQRRSLQDLLEEIPALSVVVDSFEQRVQAPRCRREADQYYSGKKRYHSLKAQILVDEFTGRVVSTCASVSGRTADLTLLRHSGVLDDLPAGSGVLGDLGYVGLPKSYPKLKVQLPHKKGRKQDLSEQQRLDNRYFAARRVVVENTILRLRRFAALSQSDREHRKMHTERVAAVGGLVNRQLEYRLGLVA